MDACLLLETDAVNVFSIIVSERKNSVYVIRADVPSSFLVVVRPAASSCSLCFGPSGSNANVPSSPPL